MSQDLRAVCFGEVLMDVFPDGERIGGAPLNVAARLSSLGIKTDLISKVGTDDNAKKILSFLNEKGIGTDHIFEDKEYATGIVQVALSEKGSATYEIAYPAAWDKIEVGKSGQEVVAEADFFIFGSLASRDSKSRRTLLNLLERARYKVLDINLRKPHYTEEIIRELLSKADFIKFNDEELLQIGKMLGFKNDSLERNIHFLAEMLPDRTICVTRGRHGAILWREGKLYRNDGCRIEVKDTVGAGDSFLAALLVKLFKEGDAQEALDYASVLGALVAGQKGANPVFTPSEVSDFMEQNRFRE